MQRSSEERAELQAELQALEEQLKDDDGHLLNLHEWIVPMLQASINPKDLYRAIEDHGLVVQTVLTARGFSLFGITANGIEFCQQHEQEAVERNRLTMEIMKHMKNYKSKSDLLSQGMDKLWGEETKMEPRSQETEKELRDSLQAISDMLLLPIADLIRKKKHVTFALSGRLMSFPFAALPFYGKPLVLQKSLSITPSLSLLFHLSQGPARSRKRPLVSTIAKRVVKTRMTESMLEPSAAYVWYRGGIYRKNLWQDRLKWRRDRYRTV